MLWWCQGLLHLVITRLHAYLKWFARFLRFICKKLHRPVRTGSAWIKCNCSSINPGFLKQLIAPADFMRFDFEPFPIARIFQLEIFASCVAPCALRPWSRTSKRLWSPLALKITNFVYMWFYQRFWLPPNCNCFPFRIKKSFLSRLLFPTGSTNLCLRTVIISNSP